MVEDDTSWDLDKFTTVTNGKYHYVCSRLTIYKAMQDVTDSCQWVHMEIEVGP